MISANDIKEIDTHYALTQTTVTLSLYSPIIYECKNI